ncbi:MAG: cache domain-containing protein [Candidatus Curtissbacteria bacterium]|nr:cache domain-containing protein [Candidatus Curtissbacteria bacterium]
MFWGIRLPSLWMFSLIAVAGLLGAGYLILSRGADTSTGGQLSRREATIARAGASNIASFFQVFGPSVVVLSQLSSMESLGTETLEDMDTFVDQWRDIGLVGGVVLTDRNGVVQLNSNALRTSDIGASLADRDYFVWAKGKSKEGEYFIGQPVVSRLGATKDQIIVPVAASVYQNKAFVGVISASVKLKPLTERYLGLIKISERTSVYLLSEQGEPLYSNSGSQTLSDNLKKALSTTKEGGQLRAEGQSIAYSPVSLGSQNWLLIVSSPIGEVSSIPFYIRQVAVLLSVSLTTLTLGVYVSRQSQKRKSRQIRP